MSSHCPTCTCERAEERKRREAEARRLREEREQREEAERDFARRHAVISEDDLAWARSGLAARWGVSR